MADQRTVKCLIALAVDQKGYWCAMGWAWAHAQQMLTSASDGVDDGASRYLVEVEVPIPTVPTIQAQATPAEEQA